MEVVVNTAPRPNEIYVSGEAVAIDCNPQADEVQFSEPEEGDYTTTDYRHWYQFGKLVLTLRLEDDYVIALHRHMNKERFWPNAWAISDHGNAHLLSLA